MNQPIRKILKKYRYIVITATLFMAALGVVSLDFYTNKFANLNQQELLEPLSNSEYRTESATLIVLMKNDNPKTSLEYARTKFESDSKFARSCHPLMHDLAHEAYKKYQDFTAAVLFNDGICNSGYLHGLIEAHFGSAKDIKAALLTTCPPELNQTFQNWQCFHGIGHGVMYFTSENLSESLSMCELLASQFETTACVNGAFMEYFTTIDHNGDTTPATKLLGNEGALKACQDQNLSYQRNCYLYAPTAYLELHTNQYLKALSWCDDAEADYINTCVSGVGSQVMKENISRPAVAANVCLSANKKQKSFCAAGALGLFINHYGTVEPAKALCDYEFASFRELCLDTIKERQKDFAIF